MDCSRLLSSLRKLLHFREAVTLAEVDILLAVKNGEVYRGADRVDSCTDVSRFPAGDS